MKRILLCFLIILSQLLATFSLSQTTLVFDAQGNNSFSKDIPKTRHLPQPMYTGLQALQNGNITFFESIPQSFQDSVASIDVKVLAVLISSNVKSTNFYKDAVGNLWVAANYTLKEGNYISTLAWVSSETVSSNFTIPESIPFPQRYPENVTAFLSSGRKLPVNDTIIQAIAKEKKNPQDMIETVRNILHFVNITQTYNRDKIMQLVDGKVNTTDILDFVNGPLESLATNSSFCFERALLAVAIMRAASVPARTFNDVTLKTWIQVWLPDTGWVDAEVLCDPYLPYFPRPLSAAIPRMIENSSDAIFPFSWSPSVLMRISNITISNFDTVKIDGYGTMMSQPVNINIYAAAPEMFSFPIIFTPEKLLAALTLNGSELIFYLSNEEKSISKTLVLGESNNLQLGNVALSFKPIQLGDMVVLQNLSVWEVSVFDFRILAPIVVAIFAITIIWLFWKRARKKAV